MIIGFVSCEWGVIGQRVVFRVWPWHVDLLRMLSLFFHIEYACSSFLSCVSWELDSWTMRCSSSKCIGECQARVWASYILKAWRAKYIHAFRQQCLHSIVYLLLLFYYFCKELWNSCLQKSLGLASPKFRETHLYLYFLTSYPHHLYITRTAYRIKPKALALGLPHSLCRSY